MVTNEEPTVKELLERIERLEAKDKKSERVNHSWLFIVFNLILSLGLVLTFLERFVELTNKMYPNMSHLTIGMSTLPPSWDWVISVNNVLNTRDVIGIALILTLAAFVYEFINTLHKVFGKKEKRGK